ncbi:MAG: hypothetical protein ABIN89_19150 [Chitinophagaceae bacterium]
MESATPSYDGKQVAISNSAQGADVSSINLWMWIQKSSVKIQFFPLLVLAAGLSITNLFYSWIISADSKDPTS